ncbi:MAG: DMT family transporter [Arenicellales bacterium]
MKAVSKTMGPVEWSLLIILSVLWGGSFFFVAVAVHGLPPFTIVGLRVALAAVALNAFILASGRRMPADPRIWLAFLGMGVLNNTIPFSLIVWGQTHIASGLASILNAATPLFSVVVAHWLTRDERLTPLRLTGVVIGFTGVVVIIGPGALRGLGTHSLAQLAILGAALSYAFAAVFGRRFRALGLAPQVTATGQVTASTLILAPAALLIDHPWNLAVPGIGIWAAILGLALLSTTVAYIIYFRILATSGATNILLVTFLIPVSAILLGATFLGEELLSRHFAGMSLISLGLAAIDGRLPGVLRAAWARTPRSDY